MIRKGMGEKIEKFQTITTLMHPNITKNICSSKLLNVRKDWMGSLDFHPYSPIPRHPPYLPTLPELWQKRLSTKQSFISSRHQWTYRRHGLPLLPGNNEMLLLPPCWIEIKTFTTAYGNEAPYPDVSGGHLRSDNEAIVFLSTRLISVENHRNQNSNSYSAMTRAPPYPMNWDQVITWISGGSNEQVKIEGLNKI